jgi:CRISPR-associated protein Cmr4
MFREKNLFFLHAISAVHAGSGSELGLVDLPIQREKHTSYPKIESSSLKGAVRATVDTMLEGINNRQQWLNTIFGRESEPDKNNAQAGAISLADARLLLFPVKSLRGVFAWVTCPQVLRRFNNEIRLYNIAHEVLPVPPENTVAGQALIVQKNKEEAKVILEEYTYEVKSDESCQKLAAILQDWAFPDMENGFAERLIVLPDDDFTDFVTLSTEVNARINIDSTTGTVKNGALWYEENVPPETLFYSFVFTGDARTGEAKTAEEIKEFLQREDVFPEVFQLGGNSTLGKGMLRRIWA